MIRYALSCAKDHQFDSWFQSAAAFEKLQVAGLVECAICGSADVTKRIMAPQVRTSEKDRPLSAPASPAEQAVRELQAKIEAHSEDVGDRFATEARAMHEGSAPERPIRGQAKLKEAKALIEDGVPVMPLPFGPTGRKSN
ncbi:hypothetical protein C8N43_1613 [Litoreibacter ponti]|uniref:DUF1178 family protein n=1 Tax=Litoreibacter ponti TaxID=1510457 RepID=A0A2T6BLJ8_9RHOB|nr:DUF1178 family protein [Litoreibacter ponti]PTX56948.1 hypothetical protein C8N43_1613 [Litoreibacter ponti]